jgi:hypothetical protein
MRTADRERRNATRIRRGPPRPTPDRAHLGELQQPPRAELASVAAALHPAERQPRIEDDDGVHEDHPGVDPRGDRPAAIVVGGPHGRAQAVVGVVGQRDRRGLVGQVGDRRDRAERLLAEHAHRAVHAGEDDRVTHEPSRNPPVCCRAPAATDSSTCARSASAKRGWASGPIWVDGSVGSPTRSAAVFSMTACSKASATGSTAMRRLALMQAWPAFVNRDATAPPPPARCRRPRVRRRGPSRRARGPTSSARARRSRRRSTPPARSR